ncbi:MAG TPA: metal-dependent phosphohydrolase [Planctomycetota bacterium]|nr:metal-dependent phosphohydrolase [Planctomycetota bacterium]
MLLELTRRYTEPHRHYHDIRHIAQMLAWGSTLQLDEAQTFAIWFHDAVYDPRSSTNEEDSAALAERFLQRDAHGDNLINTVTRIVLDTKRHKPTIDASAVVLDLDLAFLALPWPQFRANADAIRREYAHLSDAEFRAGRATMLGSLLQRPHIFTTRWGQAREADARANITRLLAEE